MDRPEIVRRAFAAFERRDHPALLDLLAPDVELRVAPPSGGRPTLTRRTLYRGVDEFREWLREVDEDFDRLQLEAREVRVEDDAVVVFGTVVWDRPSGGGGMTLREVWRFEGERVKRIEVDFDWGPRGADEPV
jgi:ketosteroid isomerase-like protein